MISFGYNWKDEATEPFDGLRGKRERKSGFEHEFWPESPELSEFPSKEVGKAEAGARLGAKMSSVSFM